MGVVDRERVIQAGFNIVGRIVIASWQKTTGQDAQPPLDLVEPGAMFGRTMEDRLRGRIPQARPPLHTSAQGLGHTGHVAPVGAQTADLEAPGRLEILHHPVVTRPIGQWGDDVGQMGGKIVTGTRLAQRPHDVTGGHHKRGEHRPHPMPDVLMRALLRLARCHGRWGIWAVPPRHAGLCIRTDHHTALRKATVGVEGEGTEVMRFGLAIRSVAVKPGDTAMRLQVCLIAHAPASRTPHGPGAPLHKGGAQVVATPTRGSAVGRGGCTGGHRHPIQTR